MPSRHQNKQNRAHWFYNPRTTIKHGVLDNEHSESCCIIQLDDIEFVQFWFFVVIRDVYRYKIFVWNKSIKQYKSGFGISPSLAQIPVSIYACLRNSQSLPILNLHPLAYPCCHPSDQTLHHYCHCHYLWIHFRMVEHWASS